MNIDEVHELMEYVALSGDDITENLSKATETMLKTGTISFWYIALEEADMQEMFTMIQPRFDKAAEPLFDEHPELENAFISWKGAYKKLFSDSLDQFEYMYDSTGDIVEVVNYLNDLIDNYDAVNGDFVDTLLP